jgi:hypothetical protein
MDRSGRAFPYHSAVAEFTLGDRKLANDPSKDYVDPKVFQVVSSGNDEYDEIVVSDFYIPRHHLL